MYKDVLELSKANKDITDRIYKLIVQKAVYIKLCDEERLKIAVKLNDLEMVTDIINEGEMIARKRAARKDSRISKGQKLEDQGNNGG